MYNSNTQFNHKKHSFLYQNYKEVNKNDTHFSLSKDKSTKALEDIEISPVKK